MHVLISGGCKNGKSFYAQNLAKKESLRLGRPLYYVAAMIPRDEEDRERIARHIREREGYGFITLEQGKRPEELLYRRDVDQGGVFLLDSVTALLDNEMFDGSRSMDEQAEERVKNSLLTFVKGTENAIFVSDGIYGDCETYDAMTEHYRAVLGKIDRCLAEVCDRVIEISFGIETVWKDENRDSSDFAE